MIKEIMEEASKCVSRMHGDGVVIRDDMIPLVESFVETASSIKTDQPRRTTARSMTHRMATVSRARIAKG